MKRIFFIVFNIFCVMMFTLNVFAADPRIFIGDWESDSDEPYEFGISVTYGDEEAWGDKERIYLHDEIETFIMLMINGDFISDADVIISNERTLVPLRIISERLGANVEWNDIERSIDIWQKDKHIKVYIDADTIYLNDKEIYTDVSPQIINSITYVPLRVIGEALDAKVGYYDGLYAPLVWVFNKTDEIKVSEDEAIKISEDVYFNKFLPTFAGDDGIIPNANVNINEIIPDNFNEKMSDWFNNGLKYDIKCVSDFGEYYCISYFQDNYRYDKGDISFRTNDILIDKYDGSYYPISGASRVCMEITENDDFGSWFWKYQ